MTARAPVSYDGQLGRDTMTHMLRARWWSKLCNLSLRARFGPRLINGSLRNGVFTEKADIVR